MSRVLEALGSAVFGNGPTTISRAQIEQALTGRGYVKGAYRTLTQPKYTRDQVITAAIDFSLSQQSLSHRPARSMSLEPSKWLAVVDGALKAAQQIALQVVETRELTAAEQMAAARAQTFPR